MKSLNSIAVLLAFVAPLAVAKDKKKDALSALFANARYVYVQAEDGDIMKPGLFPEDRDAIVNVQDALKNWHRYALTLNRREADLVLIVRKGRLAGAQGHAGVSVGTPAGRNPTGPGNSNPGGYPDRTDSADTLGARSDVGPSDDLLRVFALTGEGQLSGPLWSREMTDGLDAPNVMLLRSLRDAVDRAYPPQPVNPPPSSKP